MKVLQVFRDLIKANKDFYKGLKDKKQMSKVNIDPVQMYETVHSKSRPCFVLSTGRSGTMLLSRILEKCSETSVYHSPELELEYFSKFAYHNQDNSALLKNIVDAARYEFIRNDYLIGNTYIETNNRITFFAYQLAELYPNARFLHLIRNPESFIRSGLRRNWYQGNFHDEGRITPADGKHAEKWTSYTQPEKIAWLWNETNAFIEQFKLKHPESVKTVFAEDLFSDPHSAMEILTFFECDGLNTSKLQKMIKRPINKGVGKTVDFDIDQVASLLPLKGQYYG